MGRRVWGMGVLWGLVLLWGLGCTVIPEDGDGDGVLAEADCDDGDAAVYPGAEEGCDGKDSDCDGELPVGEADGDGDGFIGCGLGGGPADCDDGDATIYPGAVEICDGRNEDCEGEADDGLPTWTVYKDRDGDGYGAEAEEVCRATAGTVSNAEDCDDGNGAVNPGAAEVCDRVDNDCEGGIDEGFSQIAVYADQDFDGHGAGEAKLACSVETGWSQVNTDCDDADPLVNPGAEETCNGEDDDCDQLLWSEEADVDKDGYMLCEEDCDDSVGNIYPGAQEICDGKDGDCDGEIPENEGDGDGDGSLFCVDCDDHSPVIYPGAEEACDGKDGNCDGQVPEGEADGDGDGFLSCEDCDDGDGTIYPGALEVCDAIDQDCDGDVTAGAYYRDEDGDGFGWEESADAVPYYACDRPEGYVLARGDCDDGDPGRYPGAVEVPEDGEDSDCGGRDEDDLYCGVGCNLPARLAEARQQNQARTVWVGPGEWKLEGALGVWPGIKLRSTHGAGVTILDGQGKDTVLAMTEGQGPETWVDGFTLRNGKAKGENGGGIFLYLASPELRNLVIEGNQADVGGGVYMDTSSPRLVRCEIRDNEALSDEDVAGGAFCSAKGGGGIYARNSSPTIQGSVIEGNTGRYGAGLLLADTGGTETTGYGVIEQTRIVGNLAVLRGGGLYLCEVRPTLTQVVVEGNQAGELGGGLQLCDDGTTAKVGSKPTLESVSVWGNSAKEGAGLNVFRSSLNMSQSVVVANQLLEGGFGGGMRIQDIDSKAVLTGSILAYNEGSQLYLGNGIGGAVAPVLTDVDIYSPVAGEGCVEDKALSLCEGLVYLSEEPGFLEYDEGGMPVGPRLSEASGLVDAGSTSALDEDGSPSQLGIYGGPRGATWDLDGDGVSDWYWPGAWDAAPEGEEGSSWDPDDRDVYQPGMDLP